MDFKALIRNLGHRIQQFRSEVNNAEAAKNAFVMPFIKELGYDVFNPSEVMPGFPAGTGLRRSSGIVGCTILKDRTPLILIECTPHTTPLHTCGTPQLLRHFSASASFLIHTNGIEYQFYSRLSVSGDKNEKSFLAFDITTITDHQIEELKKFHKACFELDRFMDTNSDQLYTNALRKLIHRELQDPSPELVRYFARQVFAGSVTQKVIRHFMVLTRKSFQQYINDLNTGQHQPATREVTIPVQVQTTGHSCKLNHKEISIPEALEAFTIVRSILRQMIPVGRIVYRTTQSYLAILLDNKERKTICRLYFNNGTKYLGLFYEQKKETKIELIALDDLFLYGNALKKIAGQLDNRRVSTEEMLN